MSLWAPTRLQLIPRLRSPPPSAALERPGQISGHLARVAPQLASPQMESAAILVCRRPEIPNLSPILYGHFVPLQPEKWSVYSCPPLMRASCFCCRWNCATHLHSANSARLFPLYKLDGPPGIWPFGSLQLSLLQLGFVRSGPVQSSPVQFGPRSR